MSTLLESHDAVVVARAASDLAFEISQKLESILIDRAVERARAIAAPGQDAVVTVQVMLDSLDAEVLTHWLQRVRESSYVQRTA